MQFGAFKVNKKPTATTTTTTGTHLEIELHNARYDERNAGQDAAHGELLQRSTYADQAQHRIERNIVQGYENQNEQGIEHLQLIRLEVPGAHVAVHARRLEGPA